MGPDRQIMLIASSYEKLSIEIKGALKETKSQRLVEGKSAGLSIASDVSQALILEAVRHPTSQEH
jgi:hypothetical protein